MKSLPDKYNRPDITQAYENNMFRYLCSLYPEINRDKLLRFIRSQMKSKYNHRELEVLTQPTYGNYVTEMMTIPEFYRKYVDDVAAPCGNIYMEQSVKKSMVTDMVITQKEARSKAKKAMLEYLAVGDDANAKKKNFEQATAKINMNSLPGGMNSGYNLFFDKSGFNSITSFARCLIMTSYSVVERLLGSNVYLPDEETLLNYLIINTNDCPPFEQIDAVVKKYKLYQPPYFEVAAKYIALTEQYSKINRRATIESYLQGLDQQVITYLFYCQDLREIIFTNEAKFKPLIREVLEKKDLTINQDVAPDQFKQLDQDLQSMLTVVQNDQLKDVLIKDISSKKPELGKLLYTYGKYYESFFEDIDDIFDTFIRVPTMIDHVYNQNKMYRKSVVLSDTDSVIFTTKDWVEWYTGDPVSCGKEACDISSMVIYWVTKVVEFNLNKLSLRTGCQDDRVKIMQMKNEFLYPRMLIYPQKKVYAGIQMIREGTVLPELKMDLKGQQLRGSTLNQETLDTIEDLIIEKVLKDSMQGKLSISSLINYVMEYEDKIYRSLERGELTYLKSQSLKMEHHYKDAMRSAYFNMVAWNEIFGDKYGVIVPPCKSPTVSIIKIHDEYLKELAKSSPKIYRNLVAFYEKHGKYPSALPISVLQSKVPAEIVPLIDVRHHVFTNTSPMHKTLSGLGIIVGFEKNKLLLRDVYNHIG